MKSTIHISNPKSRLSLSFVAVIALSGLLLPTPGRAQGGGETKDYLPEKYSASKYQAVYANSAFEREILPPQIEVPVVEEKEPFEFSLVSATSKDGRYRIVLVDKKGKYKVVTDKPDKDGFHYSEIQPSAKIQEFKVRVANGGQTELVEFDTKRNSITTAPMKPVNKAPRPAVVPNIRQQPGQPPVPPSPAAKEAAQRSGAAAQQAIEKANAAAVQAGEEKSRVSGRRVVLPPSSNR